MAEQHWVPLPPGVSMVVDRNRKPGEMRIAHDGAIEFRACSKVNSFTIYRLKARMTLDDDRMQITAWLERLEK